MILVDTSVLIDYLKGADNAAVRTLDSILEMGIPYGINEFIYQEVLQGARTLEEFDRLKEYLETMSFYSLRSGKESYERAALLYFNCRRSGITIRSTIDLLIAQTAIENNLYLLHNDNDFTNMGKAVSDLKFYD
jgi:predicted nucleic acid-binding protein